MDALSHVTDKHLNLEVIIMQQYLQTFQEMICLRGLTDHTKKSYATYIKSYLNYLETILQKDPHDVSWDELRQYIFWLKQQCSLSDRTINCLV